MHLKIISFLGLFFMFTSLAHAASDVVATVDGRTITLEELNRRYNEVRNNAVANVPTKKAFLDDFIRYEIGVIEAEKRQLDKDPIVKERIRQQMYVRLIEKDLKNKVDAIKVSDGEMKDYYKSNPEVRTSHIVVEVKPGATGAERAIAKKRAEEILAEVKKSKRPFEELVKLYSDDIATKKNGGDVGYQTRISLVPGFTLSTSYYDAAIRLKTDEISNLVETPFGFHIIKLTGKNSYENANKRHIQAAVVEKKKIEIFNQYFDGLKKNYKITVNEAALK